GFILGFHFGQALIFLLRFSQVSFERVVLTLHPHLRYCDEQDQSADKDHAHNDCAGSAIAARHRYRRSATAATPRGLLWYSKQVYANHRSSKLLRAKPTATASCPGFCSRMWFSVESIGGMMRWNGFSTSTGNENSWRKASTS